MPMLAPRDVEADKESAAPPIAREFSMRPDFRRCAWYLAIGLVSLMIVGEFLRANGLAPRANPNRTWVDSLIGGAIMASAALGLLIATHSWRLRIDEIGVARRRLWWWDVWTWEEFSKGSIERQKGRFFSKKRPLWKNWLDLSLLADGDQAFVLSACKRFFLTETPESEFPDEPELKLTYQLAKSITLRPRGITARIAGRIAELDWNQFQQIRLLHYDDWSKRLRRIEFVLPQQVLLIEGVQNTVGGERRRYKTPQPLVIPPIVEAFLRKHAPQEKLVQWSLNGPPGSLEECRYRRDRARKSLFWFTWLSRTVPIGTLMLAIGLMGQNFLPFLLAQGAFPNIWWKILSVIVGILGLISQPFLIWLLLNWLRGVDEAIVKELDEWERANLNHGPGVLADE